MTQLSLFDVEEKQVDSVEVTADFKHCNKILCEWMTEFETRDEEYQSLFFKVTVRCREAIVQGRIDGKKKELPGYVVEVLEEIRNGEGIVTEEIAFYANSFLQKDRKEAVKDYAYCVGQVHHHWKAIGESRVRVLREAKQEGDWYECPFCGYMGLEFFESCKGCGKRFMKFERKTFI